MAEDEDWNGETDMGPMRGNQRLGSCCRLPEALCDTVMFFVYASFTYFPLYTKKSQ